MKTLRIAFLSLLAISLTACGGSGSSGGTTDDGPDPIPDPTAATLVFPANNTECNEGVILSDTQSTVTFFWNAGQNADSYTVTVRNLNTANSQSVISTTTEAPITIARGTPFEWFVTSRAQGTSATATSATFRFYNEGPGLTTYAPFPAEAISPARGANLSGVTSVTLEWSGSDLDNDIVEYEVFLDTSADPGTSLGTTTTAQLENVSVSAGNTYYWKIVTRDGQQNASTSEVFQFRVD